MGVQLKYCGYEVEEYLGHGCLGSAVVCRELRTNTQCVAKILRRSPARMDLLHALSALHPADHSNLVRYYGCDILYPDRDFLVTELVKGADLATIVRSGRNALSVIQWRQLYKSVACGLQALHSTGVAHGDLKPTNVIVQPPLRVKISDFGLSRLYPPDDFFCQSCCCLPYFAAPETIDASVACYDADRADMWSMGALLHFIVHGRCPFDEATTKRDLLALQAAAHLLDHAAPPHASAAWSLAAALARALLQPDPLKRATLAEVESHRWLDVPLPVAEEDGGDGGESESARPYVPAIDVLDEFSGAARSTGS